ncbi:VOC family protein [Niabella sp. CJ426]|uniref:VOC family protein n=1 Tax=Niabella sp. CJ426 TaxID=3393740 RepID=UPI003CFD2632
MSLRILSIVWGVKNLQRAIAFWSQALQYKLKREPDEDFAILVPKEGHGMQLSLKLVSSEEAKRHHIDLITDDQQAEVERLVMLGATKLKGLKYEAGADHVVLSDPDGNSFGVVLA